MTAELYRDNIGDWRCRFIAGNGRVLFVSGEGYQREAGARNALDAVLDAVGAGKLKFKRGKRYRIAEEYEREQKKARKSESRKTRGRKRK